MTLSPLQTKRKLRRTGRPIDPQATKQAAWLLLDIVRRNNPTPAELRKSADIGETRYRRAFPLIRDSVWMVGRRYEIKTETARL